MSEEEKPKEKIVLKVRPHRHFFVDGKKEFSQFFNPEIKDPKEIIKKFRDDLDWETFESYNQVAFVSFTNNEDLSEFHIKTKSTKDVEEPKEKKCETKKSKNKDLSKPT